jgi:prepilin-type processing-associated H-X9-DG protein
MHNYNQAYGCFPPAYLADKNGKPMHSWRVLLLPYMDQKALYDMYRFNEPWDSANNRRVTDLAIGLYQCSSEPDRKNPTTNYMMVVGPHMLSDGPHSKTLKEITDGTSNTIMVVEVADSGTWWAEPHDLNFEQMSFKINNSKRQGISSYHVGGVNVAFCDGSVRFLRDSTNPELVKAMLTIDGGEPIPPEQ